MNKERPLLFHCGNKTQFALLPRISLLLYKWMSHVHYFTLKDNRGQGEKEVLRGKGVYQA